MFLTVLLFYNFILAPELKSIKQLKSQILQIGNSLIQVNATNNNSKKPNLVQFLEKRETLWISCFQRSGSVPNCYAGSMTQFRKMGWILKNKFWKKKHPKLLIRFWIFDWNWRENSSNSHNLLTNYKNGPRLLVLEKLQLENTAPALLEPKLSIEMILSTHRRL